LTGQQSQALAPLLRPARPVTEKAVEQSTRRRGEIEARAEMASLVWGPGAGAEGGREALF